MAFFSSVNSLAASWRVREPRAEGSGFLHLSEVEVIHLSGGDKNSPQELARSTNGGIQVGGKALGCQEPLS